MPPPNISDSEWAVMEVLWERPSQTASEITKALRPSTNWAENTVRTLLTRLVEKGALKTGENAGATNVPGMEIETLSKYGVNILVDFKPEDSPMRPEAAEIFRRRLKGGEVRGTCLPVGVPLGTLLSEPFKIVQSPRLIAVLFEDTHRQIYTDGRALPKEFAQPSWLGYSIGKWDRDILLVETGGFNDKTWLDVTGHPHSEALRIAERYHRRDFGHLDAEMTFDDPEMYTKPFTIKVTYELQGNSDIFEYFCDENEKDSAHTGKN